MKKYLIFLLFILISCEKDILEPLSEPTKQLIFESSKSLVIDGQDISFEIITNTQHQLVITQQDGSVITKETFTPTLGINTKVLYTKALPKESLNLILYQGSDEYKKTTIIVQ